MGEIDTVQYNDTSVEELSVRVVKKIADLEGKSPTEITPPLHAVIDPDALNSLFKANSITEAEGSIRFNYCGYNICVRSNGEITVVKI